MELRNGKLFISHSGLNGLNSFSSVIRANIDGTEVWIDNKLIVHLYETMRYNFLKNNPDGNFEDYCNSMFDKTKK
jgi:hypothetical protein